MNTQKQKDLLLALLLNVIVYYVMYLYVTPIFQKYLDVPVKVIHVTKMVEAQIVTPQDEPEQKTWSNVTIGNKNSLAFKNNNPGNLKYANQKNAKRGLGGFARFVTVEEGFNGLINQVKLDQTRGLPLDKFIKKYAPSNDGNNTVDYIYMVSSWLNVSPIININKLNAQDLATQIIKIESNSSVIYK